MDKKNEVDVVLAKVAAAQGTPTADLHKAVPFGTLTPADYSVLYEAGLL